jgi:hypothetical protein
MKEIDKYANLPWETRGGIYEVVVKNDIKYLNQEQSRATCTVLIRERAHPTQFTQVPQGKIMKRVGDIRMMGNFSPIWINWKGKSIQLEKLLQIGW